MSRSFDVQFFICDLVPFAQFKKRKKHPRRSVTFSNKVAGFSLQIYQKWHSSIAVFHFF